MKAIITHLILPFLATTCPILAEAPKIENAKPKDGVYITYGMHSYVLELKKDRFRYWFTSDRLPAKGEEVTYPLEGSFTVEGDKIVLQHEKLIPLSSNWTFKMVDGTLTMWRSDALKLLTEKKTKFDLYHVGRDNFLKTGWGSILVPTNKTAEEAWKSPRFASMEEVEEKPLPEKKTEE